MRFWPRIILCDFLLLSIKFPFLQGLTIGVWSLLRPYRHSHQLTKARWHVCVGWQQSVGVGNKVVTASRT